MRNPTEKPIQCSECGQDVPEIKNINQAGSKEAELRGFFELLESLRIFSPRALDKISNTELQSYLDYIDIQMCRQCVRIAIISIANTKAKKRKRLKTSDKLNAQNPDPAFLDPDFIFISEEASKASPHTWTDQANVGY
ncbi:MAG: hypothetical protein N4A36_01210 [Candidatus Gracilibacteria bacterium]|jgi:ribosomal protein S26|nr:hypothetical protein [Candidatus Gracilibacteria bacterium]